MYGLFTDPDGFLTKPGILLRNAKSYLPTVITGLIGMALIIWGLHGVTRASLQAFFNKPATMADVWYAIILAIVIARR
jgi:hypothetical protein